MYCIYKLNDCAVLASQSPPPSTSPQNEKKKIESNAKNRNFWLAQAAATQDPLESIISFSFVMQNGTQHA